MAADTPLVIGVDGGGTKTVAWIAPLDDRGNTVVLGRGQAGPGNPRAAGFEVAQANILAAVEAAYDNAKLPRTPATSAALCLAGAGRASEQEQIAAWAKTIRLADTVQVTGDAEPILAAASPENCGIALICGTGSLAWGRNRAGQTARCGGWGYLIGDEGGAYAIALAGLRAAVRAADGRGEMTALLPRFQNELQAATAQDLVEQIYSPQMTRERLAGFAHLVFDASPDPVARSIVENAAQELIQMISVLRKTLELPVGGYTLALAGSVILNEKPLADIVQARIANEFAAPADTVPVAEPVRGAVALARKAATE